MLSKTYLRIPENLVLSRYIYVKIEKLENEKCNLTTLFKRWHFILHTYVFYISHIHLFSTLAFYIFF